MLQEPEPVVIEKVPFDVKMWYFCEPIVFTSLPPVATKVGAETPSP
jgi:hypothetical protein